MFQVQSTKTRLVERAASAAAFIAAVASVGALGRFGHMSPLCLALVSALIAAGSVALLRVPAPFEARFSRSVDWWRHGADFAMAAIGLWAVVSVFPASRNFLCEPLVPWRISIALFGAFGMSWLARAVSLRAPATRVSLLIFLAFFWIAPFYGFFHAPWFIAQTIASPCADRPLPQSLIAAAGMILAAEAGQRLADFCLGRRRDTKAFCRANLERSGVRFYCALLWARAGLVRIDKDAAWKRRARRG